MEQRRLNRRRRSRLLSWYITSPLLLAVVIACGVMWYEILDEDQKDNIKWRFFPGQQQEEDLIIEEELMIEDSGLTKLDSNTEEILQNLKTKYASVPQFFNTHNNNNEGGGGGAAGGRGEETFDTYQFLHLHHMKTGGTSMDQKLHCAMERLQKGGGEQQQKYDVPYFNIHECSEKYYEQCINGDPRCMKNSHEASIMSYCAPLKDLPTFGWTEPPTLGSITVLRHPVDRVWSMYRFQTKACYKCRPLLDIYKSIDDGTADDEYRPMCLKQMQNHEVANLLSSEEAAAANSTDQDRVNEAIENFNWFTIVGLTEELPTTVDMVGKVFPWMADVVDWSTTECPLKHENASPQNNRCGPDGFSHLDLPDHPDEQTRLAIEKHNAMDILLYNAAVQHFELQKQALGIE